MTDTELVGNGGAVVEAIVAAVKDVPGVGDVAAVVRRGVRAATRPSPGRPVDVTRTPVVDRVDAPPSFLDGGPVDIPADGPHTLQAALRVAAELAPDKGTVYLVPDGPDSTQTYPELLAEAQRVLTGLRAAGLRPGDAALFVFEDNRAYLTAFWACVLGGFVPTPVAVATTYESANEANRKLHNAWLLLDRPVLVTDTATAGPLAGVRALWDEPGVRILTVAELIDNEPGTDWFPATPTTPVLNLLTSGSTGVPKCVHHTNASVVARSYAVAEHCGLTSDDVSLIWMPLDHVTVAMYNVRDVFLRCQHVNARTQHFLGDCLLWLDWIDRYRVTNTWAPNFAFAMVNERAAEIRDRSWDLSCVREMTNAGEPVIAATSHRFLELLAPHGLPADVMTPCWGMSETCSGVTYTRQSREDRAAGTVAIDPATLSKTIRHLDPADRDAVVLSTVGRPIPGVRLRVVDEDGQVLPEDTMGELRIRGNTMKHSYFGNAEAQRESYDDDGWFRTGDLAFVHEGEVVIAGRIKDQIIVRGINYLAHELESVVERVDGVRVTFSAAAGVREPGASTDQLVIFFVPEQWGAAAPAGIAAEVRAVLGREAGLAPDLLVPVSETEFPKTVSGKKQRAALVDALTAGTFADRVITAEPDDGAADTWVATRQWVELPRIHGDTGPVVVLAEDDDAAALGLDRPITECGDRDRLRELLAGASTVVYALPLAAQGDPAQRLATVTAELTNVVAALADSTARLLVLTSGAVHARPGDTVDLGTCALPALVRTAVAELGTLTIRQVDLPADRTEWTDAVRAELADGHTTGIVAVRDGRRWQPRLAPVDEPQATDVPPVRPGGCYLVTGGLGGIASDIAGYLVASYGVRLLLVGRSAPTGERAERLAELTALGDVAYRQVDVADTAALAAEVAATEAGWGAPLAGVLHLAGADPTVQWANLAQHTVATESADTFAEQYRAKVAGTLAIGQVLADRPDATLVLFGSVNGEFGGHSFGAYSAANCFVTGFADHWHHERGRSVRCLSWSMWTGVGMNRSQPTAAARNRGFRAIDADDGLRLFLEAVAGPQHHRIIGLDLANPAIVGELVPGRLRVSEVLVAYTADGVTPETVRAAAAAGVRECPVPVRLVEVPDLPRDAGGAVDAAQVLLETAPGRRGRPFTAPATDLEQRIARIWSDALGRQEIGRDDSFFELGGNSLRAARLLALVDGRLGVRISTQQLYENPTVAGMAAVLTG